MTWYLGSLLNSCSNFVFSQTISLAISLPVADRTPAWSHVVDDAVAVVDADAGEWPVCRSPRRRNSVCETSETSRSTIKKTRIARQFASILSSKVRFQHRTPVHNADASEYAGCDRFDFSRIQRRGKTRERENPHVPIARTVPSLGNPRTALPNRALDSYLLYFITKSDSVQFCL